MENESSYLNNTLNIFTILDLKDSNNSKKISNNKKLNIKKLWDIAQNPYINDPNLKKVLNDQELSKIFHNILKDTSLFYFPVVKAASSNTVERISKDFQITSFSSKKNYELIYIKLKFFVKIDKKIKYLYVKKNNQLLSKELPQMINNEIQFILNQNDNFFVSLKDPNTEIFIR
ncbi:hypothetical protein OBA40_03630 [Alphaproteobacteria bacterium]|nr:hypothetical protein [Alphaproteobacteria bacterium]